MQIELSVVIVTYNSSSYILDCLCSLVQSCHVSTQVVIVDNASTDATLDILYSHQNAFALSFTQFTIIASPVNKGYTRGINEGLRCVQGQSVLLLNPDVRVTGDLNLLMQMLDDPKIGIIAPQLRFPDGSVQASCRRFPRRRDVFLECLGFSSFFRANRIFNHWKMPDFDHLTEYLNCQPQGAFLLTRKAVIRKIGMLDERFPMFFSDVDWCQRVINAGYIVKFTPRTWMIHSKGQSISQRRLEMIISSHRSFVTYFHKQEHRLWHKIGTHLVFVVLLIGTLPRLLFTMLRENS
ncbi:MAG: glycosyltransferase family 2 protein [candidate division KSB1 bacterium]|nr:glycosyltransferase family 2 protein [candidate division KSB1 bacterium]